MKKIIILAAAIAIAASANSGLDETLESVGDWCESHKKTLKVGHLQTRAYKLDEQQVESKQMSDITETVCAECSRAPKKDFGIPLEKTQPNKSYSKMYADDNFYEINPKKCLWAKLGGLCDYPVRLGTGIPLAAAGAALDLGVDGIGPMGRWAEKNPKLAASLRAVVNILNDVQIFGTTADSNGYHLLYHEKQVQKFAAAHLAMTILESATQSLWDARRLKAGKPRRFNNEQKIIILIFDTFARTIQIAKQHKKLDSKIVEIHTSLEPLCSGMANIFRAGNDSREIATLMIFTIARLMLHIGMTR
ncbi:hypothetical protein HOD08_01830 [bacterium]|nr:hypothetical protein [bacterium]